jgi:carbonic anhydrase
MNRYHQLILSNMAWSVEKKQDDPAYFARHAGRQTPVFLWIGSTDSRLDPERITRSPPGSLHIHRNFGNLVSETDLNLMATLDHAVNELGVRHILLCGTHDCPALAHVLNDELEDGPLREWLAPARAVLANHREEIESQSTPEAKLARLVECNVRDQLVRLAQTAVVQRAFAGSADLWLHGWVYDLRDGLIKRLMELDRASDLGAVPRPQNVLFSSDS